MFSKELEEVIEAALADGVITEKERAVLHRRAMAEGVDPDELDVVIDGRLAKVKKETDWLRPTPPPQAAPANNGKHGSVRKCPNCGAVVEAAAVKCAECGYEFVGIEANSSVARFAEKLEEIERRHSQNNSVFNAIGGVFGNDGRTKEIRTFVLNFPVPTTREDLLEFILYIQPKIKSLVGSEHRSSQQIGLAYKSKYIECIQKATFYFANDPQFKPLIEQYEDSKKFRWRNMSPQTRILIGVLLMFVFLGVIIPLIIFIVTSN